MGLLARIGWLTSAEGATTSEAAKLSFAITIIVVAITTATAVFWRTFCLELRLVLRYPRQSGKTIRGRIYDSEVLCKIFR